MRWHLDAAYFPGGRAEVGYLPRTEGEVAAILRAHPRVLAVGAQSSLTGGATPGGGAVLATERFDAMEIDAERRIARCGAGVPLSAVQGAASEHGLFVGPAPTWDGAFVGGAVSTNAAGAATFRYGTMREAVLAITVVLADGSVLDLRRGEVRAHPDGWFEVVLVDGDVRRVAVPSYRVPGVPKCSAGYFAAPGMDLVDLFVGSEGTLGVVTQAELQLQARPASTLACWLAVEDEGPGIVAASRLRDASRATWETGDPDGLDVPAIEHLDRRCVELLREDGEDARHGVPLDPDCAMVLTFPVSLPAGVDADDVLGQIEEPDRGDGPVRRLVRLLGPLAERLEVAMPGEERRAAAFAALREAVPTAVNHRVRDARNADPRIHKVAGDFIVPWERFADAMAAYRAEFGRRGLDHAIWGHISDGNVHPNVIPRSYADVESGKEAVLALGREVVAMGGSPLAEHGVGRHPVKQELMRALYGDRGVREMRAVKRALDPEGKLAPGVLFAEPDAHEH